MGYILRYNEYISWKGAFMAMPESKAHAEWTAKNTTVISVRLNNKLDKDILDFLRDKNKQKLIKDLLRMEMNNTTITTPAKGEKGQGEK